MVILYSYNMVMGVTLYHCLLRHLRLKYHNALWRSWLAE
jgi:hypothetical protein